MRLINILFLSVILSSCSSLVNVDYDNTINFSLLKTYTVNEKPVRVSKDTRINSPFMQHRVVDELKATLTNKGYENLKGKADLEIKYYLDIKQEIETLDSSVSIGFGSSGYNSAIGFGFNIPIGETSSFDNLVLTIDVVSIKNNKLIWRGSLGHPLYEGEKPESYSKMIKGLVTEILKEFPPK